MRSSSAKIDPHAKLKKYSRQIEKVGPPKTKKYLVPLVKMKATEERRFSVYILPAGIQCRHNPPSLEKPRSVLRPYFFFPSTQCERLHWNEQNYFIR